MTLHRASRYTLALALPALLALPAAAGAQAFGLNEIGSCALSRGFAVTATPCDDASSVYWNPGAMPRARGWSFYGGAATILINGDFIQDTTFNTYKGDVPAAVVPHLFVTYRGAGKLAYGFGVYVPYGLTSQWKDDFPGRFAAKKAALHTIYVQPNVSYQITPNWSIGGGPVFGHSTVELIQGVDLSQIATPAGPTFGQLGIPKQVEGVIHRVRHRHRRAREAHSGVGHGGALPVAALVQLR
jgi:long-chain fatty acid transport protein